jgi:5S rRNA maturation endonuclease (ribonuclease M5)
VVKCHLGCSTDDILAELGLTRADLFDEPRQAKEGRAVVAEYPYRDESGEVLYVKERHWPKDFRQYVPLPGGRKRYKLDGVRRVLYRLPELKAAIAESRSVFVVEGEKDADELAKAGVTATCNTEGASKDGQSPKWRKEYTEQLRSAMVTVVADKDEAGQAHAGHIAKELTGVAAHVRIVEAIDGKDAYDHLQAGWHVRDFAETYDQLKVEGPADAAPPEPPSEATRRIRLTPLSTVKPRPVRWVWDERIPNGELTLTPGRGGLGKSTFHAWVVAHLTRGALPGVHSGTPKPCIVAAAEDSYARTVVPRLIAAGADMDLVYRVDVVTETNEEMTISLPRDIESLVLEVRRIGAAAVSLDPVMSLIFSELDTHRDREMRLALEPLVSMADRTDCAVLGNAHFNKSTGSDPLMMIMASSAFGNVARAALGFARDADGSCVISQIKNNLGRLDLPSLKYRINSTTVETDEGPAEVGRLVMDGESKRSVADILRGRGDRDSKSKNKEVDQWLIKYLTDRDGREAPAAEVIAAAEDAGYSENAIKKARGRIGAESKRSGFGKDAFYTWMLIDADASNPRTHGTHETQDELIPPTQLNTENARELAPMDAMDSMGARVSTHEESMGADTCQVPTWRVCKNPKCQLFGGCVLADTATTEGDDQ